MVLAICIDPSKWYDESGVCHLLDLLPDQIRAEHNRGRLRAAKRAGKRFFRGQWLIDWLEAESTAGHAPADADAVTAEVAK